MFRLWITNSADVPLDPFPLSQERSRPVFSCEISAFANLAGRILADSGVEKSGCAMRKPCTGDLYTCE